MMMDDGCYHDNKNVNDNDLQHCNTTTYVIL